MIEIYPSFDAEFPRIPEVVITSPEMAEALPVGTVLESGVVAGQVHPLLTAVKKARQYQGGRPGWMVRGFTAPEPEANFYPVVDKTLFRYASTWTVKHV